jgi:hypothetical protein
MRRLAPLIALLALLPLPLAAQDQREETGSSEELPEDAFDVIELIPDEPPSWTPNNLVAPITGFFLGGGPGYWYDAREVEIRTTPPGAVLDLFYVRRNFQKRYEQADAPARVVLPSRIEATPHDSLRVRALLDGYRQREVRIPVRSRETSVMIDLAPLPNTLLAFSHTYFAGRGSLNFFTDEALTFRLQKSGNTLSVVLTETASTPDVRNAMQGSSSALVESVKGQQLGEDLVARIVLTPRADSDAFDTRSRQTRDPVRGLHLFALDLVPSDGGAAEIERARAVLARITSDAVGACALRFDASVHDQLEPAALARALTPSGAYTDKYLRAAMRRLGEISPGGAIPMRDGSRFDVSLPIELMAAASQPDQAVGYLALLRRFVAELEEPPYRRGVLRGLVAPELAPDRFDAILDAAEQAEAECAA